MKDRVDMLRRRLAHYRHRLAEDADSELARQYLDEIVNDQAELARISKDANRRQ